MTNYPSVPAENAIADARGISVAEVRERAFRQETRTAGSMETRSDDLGARISAAVNRTDIRAHAPSVRSDALAAELATARTRGERRDAVARFMASQHTPVEGRFVNWLAGSGHERAFENRAMGEGTGSGGGYWVPTRFYQSVIHYMREYDGFLRAFEPWESEHGEAYNRAAYSEFTAASAVSEGNPITEGPEPVMFQQAWPQAGMFAASYVASNQLVADAFASVVQGQPGGFNPVASDATPWITGASSPALDALVAAALGESLGRAIAPAAQTAIYSEISGVGAASGAGGYVALGAAAPVTFASGATTELAANTISLDSAALMTEALDEAYQERAAFYMSRTHWAGILRQQDSQKHAVVVPNGPRTLYGFPVVLTSQAANAVASTVSGPVFGDLGAAMTLRTVAGSFGMLRSTERYAESLQTYYRCWLRGDVAARDSRAVVGVKYAAS